jgi:methionine-R-sulfoxide reductase
MENKIQKSEEEWRIELDPESYHVLRERATEHPFTGKYNKNTDEGTYVCKGCGTPLFTSQTKFDSGCGWPSFYEGIVLSAEKFRQHVITNSLFCAQTYATGKEKLDEKTAHYGCRIWTRHYDRNRVA